MTKAREPLTFADAVTRDVGQLTARRAADIVGRSVRLVYKWMDPETDDTPSLRQALLLDAAYSEAGGEGSPILEAYAFQLNTAVATISACRRALGGDLGDVARECGEAIESGVATLQPGASDSTIHHAMVQAEEARGALGSFIGRLKSFLPGGAAPTGEYAGGGTA